MTEEELQAIEKHVESQDVDIDAVLLRHVPALIAEVRRLKEELNRIERTGCAHGYENPDFCQKCHPD